MARPISTDSPRSKRGTTVTFTTTEEFEVAKAHAKSRGLGLATLFKMLLADDIKASSKVSR